MASTNWSHFHQSKVGAGPLVPQNPAPGRGIPNGVLTNRRGSSRIMALPDGAIKVRVGAMAAPARRCGSRVNGRRIGEINGAEMTLPRCGRSAPLCGQRRVCKRGRCSLRMISRPDRRCGDRGLRAEQVRRASRAEPLARRRSDHASDASMPLQAASRPRTAATDLSNITCSSVFSEMSMIFSTPPAPITVGTPTYIPSSPYSPSQ